MNLIELATKIATEAHKGQTRWDKKTPYITHPLAVANMVNSENEKVVAILHDVVEDTHISLDDLAASGIPKMHLEAIDAITKRDGEEYSVYIRRVSVNYMARQVKRADIKHNLTNLKHGSMRDKYLLALAYFDLYEDFNRYKDAILERSF